MQQTQNLHICHNGKMLAANTLLFDVKNRGLRYGDGFFESICAVNGRLPLFKLHFERLALAAEALKMPLPQDYTEAFFTGHIYALLRENNLENARVRLALFRAGEGLYVPQTTEAPHFIIEAEPLLQAPFLLNKTGLKVDIYAENEKHFSKYAGFKTANALLYVLASIYKKEKNLDDCLLLNSRSRVMESINSNLFLVKDKEIITPPLAEACVDGVMRKYLITHILPALKMPLQEKPLTLQDLFLADEAFLTNAIYGVQWVSKFKEKEYGSKMGKKISKELIKNISQ